MGVIKAFKRAAGVIEDAKKDVKKKPQTDEVAKKRAQKQAK